MKTIQQCRCYKQTRFDLGIWLKTNTDCAASFLLAEEVHFSESFNLLQGVCLASDQACVHLRPGTRKSRAAQSSSMTRDQWSSQDTPGVR
eukprot:1150796-Amphidinium_carterae.1